MWNHPETFLEVCGNLPIFCYPGNSNKNIWSYLIFTSRSIIPPNCTFDQKKITELKFKMADMDMQQPNSPEQTFNFFYTKNCTCVLSLLWMSKHILRVVLKWKKKCKKCKASEFCTFCPAKGAEFGYQRWEVLSNMHP